LTPEDSELITDAWWAALVADLLHPIQVQIIEVFRWIDQPLKVGEISEIIDEVEPVHLDHHLARLRKLGALDCGHPRPGTAFMDVRYWPIARRERRAVR
jgi:DNA-binding transcriptional ArsR family regulator